MRLIFYLFFMILIYMLKLSIHNRIVIGNTLIMISVLEICIPILIDMF